jgi:hypothetical protein
MNDSREKTQREKKENKQFSFDFYIKYCRKSCGKLTKNK